MRLRAVPGEIALALAFVAVGVFWVALAIRMPLWDGFAPSSGLLPLVYGALLVGLAATALLFESGGGEASGGEAQPIRAPFVVILTLAAGVAGIEPAGFAASMFLAMLFLFKVAEKLPLLPSLLASAGTAAVLTLVFRTWLGVPLPKGPWGF